MYTPSLSDKIYRKTRKVLDPLLIPVRRGKLNNLDFSIISNNCWGGICYEYFGMQKTSPTVGLWFFASDYLKFLKRMDHYLSTELQVIKPAESPNYQSLIEMGSDSGLVGILDDIEVILLHYHNVNEAKEKWKRRVARINYNNLIVKFSYMNKCTYNMLKEFDDLDLSYISGNYKKIMFVPKPMPEFKSAVYFKGFENEDQIYNDTFVFDKHIRIIPFINGDGIIQK